MGTSLSTEFDWVYDPVESRWRLGLPPSVGSAAAAYQQQHPDLNEDETDNPTDQNNDDNENTQRNNNNIRRNEKSSSFPIQHSQRNEKAISMLYFSLVQAFCSACGSDFNQDKSAAATVMKRRFDRPLVFLSDQSTVPMHDLEGGLGAVEPKTSAQTFLIARNFAPAFAELEGEDDEAGGTGQQQQHQGGGSRRTRMSLEQTRERAAAKRTALMNVQNASTTVHVSKDTSKFSPFHHFLEVADNAGRCVFARLVDGGAVVFDHLPEEHIRMLNKDLFNAAEEEAMAAKLRKLKKEKEEEEQKKLAQTQDEDADENEEQEEKSTTKPKKTRMIKIKRKKTIQKENEIGDLVEEVEETEVEEEEVNEEEEEEEGELTSIRVDSSNEQNNSEQQPPKQEEPTMASDTIVQPFDTFGLSIIKESVVEALNLEKERKKRLEAEALRAAQEAEEELKQKMKYAIEEKRARQRKMQQEHDQEHQLPNNNTHDEHETSGRKSEVQFAQERDNQQMEEEQEKEEATPPPTTTTVPTANEEESQENNKKDEDEQQEGGENISIFMMGDDSSNKNKNKEQKSTQQQTKGGKTDEGGEASERQKQYQQQQHLRSTSNLNQVTCHSLHHLMTYLSLVASVAVSEEVEYILNYTTVEEDEEERREKQRHQHQHQHHFENSQVIMSGRPASSPGMSASIISQRTRPRSESGSIKMMNQSMNAAGSMSFTSNNNNNFFSGSLSTMMQNQHHQQQQQNLPRKTVGEAIQQTLWNFASESPGFIRAIEPMYHRGHHHHHRSPNSTRRTGSSPHHNRPGSTSNKNASSSPGGNKNLTFSRQPVFALRSVISRCGQTLFPPRGTAEARKLAATEENDLFFTASGSQMTVEVCSRVLAYQNSFQPFLNVSFERSFEGDLTVSRFLAPLLSSSSTNNSYKGSSSSTTNPLLLESNTSNNQNQNQPTSTSTANFSLLSKVKGLRPRISISSSATALQAIQSGKLVSAVAEAEVPGALLVAAGSSIEVCHSSPRTLRVITRELRHILESIVKDCPENAHPGEFLTRFLIDSCFNNHSELINELIGEFNSAKERSILGSKHQAGSVFKLLFGLTEMVPLPESSSGNTNNSNTDKNSPRRQQQQQRRGSSPENQEQDENNNNDTINEGEKTLERQLYEALHHSPCTRNKQASSSSSSFPPRTKQEMIAFMQKQQQQRNNNNSYMHWKDDEMEDNSPADFVNKALKTVVDRTTATSNQILDRIKEVSHVLNNTRRQKTGFFGTTSRNNHVASSSRHHHDDMDDDNESVRNDFDDNNNDDDNENKLQEQQGGTNFKQDPSRAFSNNEDPNELAALFYADRSSVDFDDYSDEGKIQKLKKILSKVPNGTMIVDQKQEMKFQQWEKALGFIQQQARMIMRVSPHPALSLSSASTIMRSSTSLNSLTDSLSSSAIATKRITLLSSSSGTNNNNNNRTVSYTQAEVLNFAKQLLMFVAALREIDSELFGQLHSMSLRMKTLHAPPPTVTAPTISLKQESLFAEAELLKTFAARAAACLGVSDLTSPSSPNLSPSSQNTTFNINESNTLMSFEAASLPYPSQESLRVTGVEIHVPAVTAAFGPANVRPLAELHITLRDQSFVQERQDVLMKKQQQQKIMNSTITNNSTSRLSKQKNLSTTDSSLASNRQLQVIKVCLYANGVLQFPDPQQQQHNNKSSNNTNKSGAAAVGSLANALASVEAASRHRSLLSTPHESTLLRTSSMKTTTTSSSSSSQQQLNTTTASLMLSRMPNRHTADQLLLMGATHYPSLHELMVNLVPGACQVWDELFNATRINAMLKSVTMKKQKEQDEFQQSKQSAKYQNMDSTFAQLAANASPIPQLRPTSALSGTSSNSEIQHHHQHYQIGKSSSSGSALRNRGATIITPDLHGTSSAMVLTDNLPRKKLLDEALFDQEGSDEYSSHPSGSPASSINVKSRNKIFGGFEETYDQFDNTTTPVSKKRQQQLREKQELVTSSSKKKLLSSTTMTPRPPPTSSSRYHHHHQQDTNSLTDAGESFNNNRSSAGGDFKGSAGDNRISISDYPVSQIHASSMMPVLLAPRLSGQPILRAISSPIFCDAASALRTHAEFFTRNLTQDNVGPLSEANFAWSLGTRWYVSGPSDFSNSASASNNTYTRTGTSSPGSAAASILDATKTYSSTMGNAAASGYHLQNSSNNNNDAAAAAAAIFAMVQNSLLHRPVVRGLAALQESAAGTVFTPSSISAMMMNTATNARRSSSHHHLSYSHHQSANNNNNNEPEATNLPNACNLLLAQSPIPPQLLQDSTIWDKVFKFLDPPKYGSEIATPSRILYGLALTKDLTIALDGFLQSIVLDNRSLEDQHEALDEFADLFHFIEKNYTHVMQNIARIACSGQTPHRVFARCISALSFFIAVCSAHFSRLSLWPNISVPNQISPSLGGVPTPLHRLLWIGLSFIDVRGLLMATVSRCTSVLNAMIDFNASEDEDAFIMAMTDSSNDEAAQEYQTQQQSKSYQSVKNTTNTNQNNPSTPHQGRRAVTFAASGNSPTDRHSPSSEFPSTPTKKPASATELLTAGDPQANDPEYIQSLKLSGAHETAALVVTYGVELIAVSSSASSEIARRWVYGTTVAPSPKVSSATSSSSFTSAPLFFLDQVFSCTLPELKIAFHLATIAWRSLCLLATPPTASSSHLTPVISPSIYASLTGQTTQDWHLPQSVVKSVAANAVAALTSSSGSVLPCPTVSSLLALIATIHRVTPGASRLFSNLRLDRPLGMLWEQLTIRQQQKSVSAYQYGGILPAGASVGGSGGTNSHHPTNNATSDVGNALLMTMRNRQSPASMFLEESMKAFGYSLAGSNANNSNSSNNASSSSKSKKKEILNAADLAGEIAESEFFFSLCWVTSVAEDSLLLPAQIAPWMRGMLFDGSITQSSSHVAQSFPPVLEKYSLPWTQSNPFSKIVSSAKLAGSTSVLFMSMLKCFCRWFHEPSSSFVGGLPIRFGAPFTLPTWFSVIERLVPTMLTHRVRDPHQLQNIISSQRQLQQNGQATVESPTGPSSSIYKSSIAASESYIQFTQELLLMLANARDSTSEVLIVDCVDLDPTIDQQNQQHHKILLSPNDVKDPLPRIEATSNFVFAQFHNALLAAHSAAATFTTTQLNNNSILNYKSQQSSPGTGTKKAKSSPSKNTPLPPILLSPAFSEILGLASNFASLVPALDILLLPHAVKQILQNLTDASSIEHLTASPLNKSDPLAPSFNFSDSLANFSFGGNHNTSGTLKPGDKIQNRDDNNSSSNASPLLPAGSINNTNNNNRNPPSAPAYSSDVRCPLGKWGSQRLTVLAENSAALFPELLFVPPEKQTLSATFAGALECVTSVRTLARVLQVSMLHFSGSIKTKILSAAVSIQQDRPPPSTTAFVAEWPLPDWTRSISTMMSLIEHVTSPHTLSVIRSSKKSAHILLELELAILSLCTHAALFINNFSQIVPALSFFLIRYAQPRHLLISDAEGVAGSSGGGTKKSFTAPSAKLLGGATSGFASAVGSSSSDSELIEASQQHRALRVALMGVIDAILQRATVMIAETAGQQQSEEDVAASNEEAILSQGMRELIANSVVALAQHTLSPAETRTRAFKFSKYPMSMGLSFDFAGPVTMAALMSNNPLVSCEFEHSTQIKERSVSAAAAQQQKKGSKNEDDDSDDDDSLEISIRVTDSPSSNNNNNNTTTTNLPSTAGINNASNLLASVPFNEQLPGRCYDVDRSTAVVFLQRLLILSKKLGLASVVLQEFARRGISATALSILDTFHSSSRGNNNNSNTNTNASTTVDSSAVAGGASLRQRQLERRPSTTNVPDVSQARQKSTLELVSDALLNTIHKYSDEVLHQAGASLKRSMR